MDYELNMREGNTNLKTKMFQRLTKVFRKNLTS
jgi:hypothetical protein